MPTKAEIFHKPTAEEIEKGNPLIVTVETIDDAVALAIQGISNDTLIEVAAPIIPQKFSEYTSRGRSYQLSRTEASRKFMKHGPEVKFPRFSSAYHAIKTMQQGRIVPVDLRAKEFDASLGPYNSMSYLPIIGNDNRKRKIPLIEVVDGAKLYRYSECQGTPIKVTPYHNAKRVGIEGAAIDVRVPSRTPHQPSYQLSILGVPIVDNAQKYVIATSLISDHTCADMRHRKRYTWEHSNENSRVFNWDAHSIAGVYAMMDFMWDTHHNLIPLQMSMIPLPSQKLVDISEVLRYQTVVRTKEDPSQKDEKTYPLNNAEREIGLHAAVQRLGHNQTLFSSKKRDGDLREYRWKMM